MESEKGSVKLRMLRVIPSMNPSNGGPCQGIRNSIPAMDALGVSTEVVSMDAPDSAFLSKDPFTIHAVGPSEGPWSYGPLLRPWLLENLVRYDVVIIHGLWLYHGYAVRKALKELRRLGLPSPRCYVMPHGMLDPYFQRDPSRKLKAIRNFFYWKTLEARVVNEADGVLFTCEEELRLAREPFRPYRPKQEFNVGYGVAEPPSLTPAMRDAFTATCPSLGDQPYLLFLSRIHPKKGVDLLIRAYADLAKGYSASSSGDQRSTLNPQRLPSLVIAGPLDSAYARQMQQLAAELIPSLSSPTADRLQITDHYLPSIHFPGMLIGDAKWGAFHGCEAFILPSHQENFGIAVVEALACGKPVLISNKVNIWREIVKSGGGIAEEDSLEGTARLLGRWLEKASDEEPSPNLARDCFVKHYSVRNAAVQLLGAMNH